MADPFLHLSDSILFPVINLTVKHYEVTKPVEILDEAFGFKIKTFSTKAEFRQKITAVEPSFTVTGELILWLAIMPPVPLPKMLNLQLKLQIRPEARLQLQSDQMQY